MPLLERVSTLIRANLNDLVDRAEDPGKMIKQVILDMENQYLQVKTQVAIAIADLHMLEKKKKENEAASAEWLRKAEKAVDKQQDDMARLALGALSQLSTAFSRLRRAGDRPAHAGGRPENGAAEAGAKAGGSKIEERYVDRASPAFAGGQPRKSRGSRDGGPGEDFHVRADGGKSASRGSSGERREGAGRRGRDRPLRPAGEE